MKNKEKNPGIFKAYLVEIRDRWLSSSKRILKTFGVFLIPFIYAFTLIAGLWNPLEKIGTIPIALCSLDKEQLVAQDLDTTNIDHNRPIAIGVPEYYTTSTDVSTAVWTLIPNSILASEVAWNSWTEPVTYIKTLGGSTLNYDHTTLVNGQSNPNGSCHIQSLMDDVMKNWQSGAMVNSGFTYQSGDNTFAITGQLSYPITNIKYHNTNNTDNLSNWDTDASQLASWNTQNKEWDITNNKDYAQITIPTNVTKDLIAALDAAISGNDYTAFIDDIKNTPVNLYVTYEKTFLAAKLVDSMLQSLTAMVSNSLPIASVSLISSIVQNISGNISTIVNNDSSESWNGGYSWIPAADVDIDALTWNDHSYTGSSGVGSIAEQTSVHFKTNQPYTIENEEFRAALIANASTPVTVKDQLSALRTDGTYVIPSVEGITANGVWNPTSDTTGGTQHSLLHRMRNISSALVEIPAIANVAASIFDFYANMQLDKIFADFADKILTIDVNETSVIRLFESDQYLCSLFLQDPRFMIPDVNAPVIPIIAVSSSIPDIGLSFNFGRLIALMCYTGDTTTPMPNTFQTVGLGSLYTKDNTNYQDTNVSYHKGNILNDIGILGTDYDYAINAPDLNSISTGYSVAGNLLTNTQIILNSLSTIYSPFSLNSYISFNKVGSEYDIYGMGIGQYFICMGLYVGTLTQVMIYDKKKRVRKIRATKWYVSKTMLMVSTSLVQATVLALAIGCLGWFHLGSAFALQWLFMLFCGLIFVSIIQALWFCFRDRAMSFFAIVVFMVLNLSAGWGTFPAFMQFPFFNYISYILPFTYMIHGQGAIVYGIATNTHVLQNSLFILQNIGILLIFPVIFYPIGLFMSHRRERELYYGTYRKYRLGGILKKMGYAKYCYETKKGTAVDWKLIPHEEMLKVKQRVNVLYPYEKAIKKYQTPTLVRDIVDFDNN